MLRRIRLHVSRGTGRRGGGGGFTTHLNSMSLAWASAQATSSGIAFDTTQPYTPGTSNSSASFPESPLTWMPSLGRVPMACHRSCTRHGVASGTRLEFRT